VQQAFLLHSLCRFLSMPMLMSVLMARQSFASNASRCELHAAPFCTTSSVLASVLRHTRRQTQCGYMMYRTSKLPMPLYTRMVSQC
jgi:hypothetical protein